jgi:hypothetical protein
VKLKLNKSLAESILVAHGIIMKLFFDLQHIACFSRSGRANGLVCSAARLQALLIQRRLRVRDVLSGND